MTDSFRQRPAIQRRRQVEARTGLSRSSIYQYIKEGLFPPPVSLGRRWVGWLESNVSAWIEGRTRGPRVAAPRQPK